MGRRIHLGNINGPDAGSGADVKNPLRVVADGRKVQLAIQDLEEDLVVKVQAVLLSVVDWHQAPVWAEIGVVAPSVLEYIFVDAGRQTGSAGVVPG